MTVLSRLFRQAPPQQKSLDDRIAELPSLSPESLATLALGDEEDALRVAAIQLLGPGDVLYGLAGLVGNESIAVSLRRAAQQRLAALLDSGSVSFGALCGPGMQIGALVAIVGQSADETQTRRLIASVDEPTQLCELALNGPSPEVRQLAAQRVQDPDTLAHLLKAARGRDKNVYRIIKSKRDALHAQEKAAADALTTMTTLCASIERHIHQPCNAAYLAALDHLASQWHEIAAQAPVDLQQRADSALQRCREVVSRQQQQLAREMAAAAAIEQAVAERATLLEELPSLLASTYEAGVDTDSRIADLAARWSALSQFKAPSREESERFERLRSAVARLSAYNAQHGSVQQQAAALDEQASHTLKRALSLAALLEDNVPEAARAAAASLQAWEQARAAEAEAAAAALRQIGGLLRKAQNALAAGHSRPAAGIRRALEEKLSPTIALPAHLVSQLQAFDEKLNALQDWRSFAVAPKRAELIEQMEALLGSTESPTALADRIKRLQDEWKLISKGNVEDTQAEWERFHQAAQKAYEPCREHFAAQARIRADNLDRRSALLTRLQEFASAQDWERPDWREVARALRESRQQWRALQPVERTANQPLQAAFDTLTADLQARLDAEYTRNADAKRLLIDRARQLLTVEDGRQAGEEVKRLQLAWKDIGLVRQDESQRLWDEFRQQCDGVFARRQQQHSEFVTQLATNATRATELCGQAEQLLTLSGLELVEAARTIPALREAFVAAGELPRAESQALRNRFERALDRCQQLLSEQRTRDRTQAWERVFEVGDRIRLYRLAVANGAPAQECEARRNEAQAFIAGVSQWPKGVQKLVTAELARASDADIAANEASLRQLCIRAELLTGIPSPAGDQALRRDWQLQQLTRGFGHGRSANSESFDSLVAEWLAIGATGDAAYFELRTRFLNCRQQTADAG